MKNLTLQISLVSIVLTAACEGVPIAATVAGSELLTATQAVGAQCLVIEDQFFDGFDCCGTGAGTPQCEGLKVGYRNGDCGTLGCVSGLGTVATITRRDELTFVTTLKLLDIASRTVTDTGVLGRGAGVGITSIDAGNVAFQSFNGETVQLYNIASGTVTAVGPGLGPSISGNIVAFGRLENRVGQDLNGDGDQLDNVMGYYDISTGVTTNIGVETVAFFTTHRRDVEGDIIAFPTPDPTVLQVLAFHTISTGATTVTALAMVRDETSIGGNVIAFKTSEFQIGDQNGDGDLLDFVARFYDVSTGVVTNTGIMTIRGFEQTVATDGTSVAVSTESGEIVVWDIASGQTTNTGIFGRVPAIDEGVVVAVALESQMGRDLNGDRDTGDAVYMLYDVVTRTSVNTRFAGSGYPDIDIVP